MEKILCAAVWYRDFKLKERNHLKLFLTRNKRKGIVFSGWRHLQCLHQAVAITGKRQCEMGKEIQGFLTDKNRFVDRREAGKIAFAAKQTKELKKYLYSEDLY